MDAIERKILERYEEKENQQSSYFSLSKGDQSAQPKKVMKNKISDLRNQLFETIDLLKTGKIDIEQAKAIAEIGQIIVNSAKVEVEFIKAADKSSSVFFIE